MLDARTIQHMYQAWRQGNDQYVRDWYNFVEFAAKQCNTTGDVVMRELQKHSWFERGER
jgi:hypothetical protein